MKKLLLFLLAAFACSTASAQVQLIDKTTVTSGQISGTSVFFVQNPIGTTSAGVHGVYPTELSKLVLAGISAGSNITIATSTISLTSTPTVTSLTTTGLVTTTITLGTATGIAYGQAGAVSLTTTLPSFTVNGTVTSGGIVSTTQTLGSSTGIAYGQAGVVSLTTTLPGFTINGNLTSTGTLTSGALTSSRAIYTGAGGVLSTTSSFLFAPAYGVLGVGSSAITYSDSNVPLQINAAANNQAALGVFKGGAYGLLLGYANTGTQGFLGRNGAYFRQVTTDPLDIVINNTVIAGVFTASASVGIGGSITSSSTMAGAMLMLNASTSNAGVNTGTSPNSTLQVNGSFATRLAETATSYTITATDGTVVSTSSGAVTLTLPSAASITGRIYDIVGSGGGAITLTSTSTITGTSSISTTGRLRAYSSGTVWYVY